MEIDYIEDSFVFDFHNSYQEKQRNRQRISQKAKAGAISKENVIPIIPKRGKLKYIYKLVKLICRRQKSTYVTDLG